MDYFYFENGPGTEYHVCLTAAKCGKDLNVSVCGGTEHHIGAVSLAVYEPARDSATVSTLCVYTHRDDVLASKLAKLLSSRLKCTVCLSVGIHIDDASPDELILLQDNAMDCCKRLLAAFNP